jgi:phosphatidylglycerophosphate synthase
VPNRTVASRTALLTVPNAVTAARVAMALGAAWIATRPGWQAEAVLVCIAALVLDAFDGWYARAFAQCSRVGEHMDPLADKILMGVVYGWIGVEASSPAVWSLVALVAVREVAMTVFRAYSLRRHGRYIPASPLGRAKMVVQGVVGTGILFATHNAGVPVPRAVVVVGLVVILVLSYASAARYLVEWRRTGRAVVPPAEADRPRVAANT